MKSNLMEFIRELFPRIEKQYNYFIPFVYEKDGKQIFAHVEWTTQTKIKGYARIERIERDLASDYEVDKVTITSYPRLLYVEK